MKKTNILVMLLLVFSFFSISVFAQGPGAQQNQQPMLLDENVEGGEIADLTPEEISGLLLMREEEKLARDVYLELYDQWSQNIFNNIASSEQTHTDAVKVLLDAYGVEDPVLSDERGSFTSEDLDIKDLNVLLENTENEDIIFVYENLRKGSRNHMRAFITQIENNGGTYEAQYLEQAEIDAIVSGEHETGPLLDADSNVVPGFESQLRAKRGTGMDVRKGLQDGTYQDSKGKQFGIMQQNNRRMMQSNGVSADCPLCDEMVQENNQFKARLSNGKNAEIKVMPDVASETALQRLRLRNCNEDCSIELKEVGSGEKVRAAYEVKAQRNSKVLGLFRARMNVQAQVDAESGEVIKVNKPWWAFLASETEE